MYLASLNINENPLFFYKEADISTVYGGTMIVDKEYGFMHTVFYIMVILYLLPDLLPE